MRGLTPLSRSRCSLSSMSGSGSIFIISAPSGSGKSTLVSGLLKQIPNLDFSVSYTTRPPRGSEKDGVEYFFVSEATFEEMIAKDEFVEHAQVFGHYYGTSKVRLEQTLASGMDVVLDIDTEGAAQVKAKYPEAIGIFVMPPSYAMLKERLEKRSLDSADTIRKRLWWASQTEIERYQRYDYVLINEDLASSSDLMRSIILAERCKTRRMLGRVESIIKTFGGH
ncbi:MAG: guanylate kinase [Acidobacteriota bacterium]